MVLVQLVNSIRLASLYKNINDGVNDKYITIIKLFSYGIFNVLIRLDRG